MRLPDQFLMSSSNLFICRCFARLPAYFPWADQQLEECAAIEPIGLRLMDRIGGVMVNETLGFPG